MEGARQVLLPRVVVHFISLEGFKARGTVARVAGVTQLTLVTLVQETVVRCSTLVFIPVLVAALCVVLTDTVQTCLRVTLPGVLVARARAAQTRYGISEVVRVQTLLAVVPYRVVLTVDTSSSLGKEIARSLSPRTGCIHTSVGVPITQINTGHTTLVLQDETCQTLLTPQTSSVILTLQAGAVQRTRTVTGTVTLPRTVWSVIAVLTNTRVYVNTLPVQTPRLRA